MIYDMLEQDFLKKTSRYKYNKSIKRIFIVADSILLIYFGILILLDYLVLESIIHPLWIGFLIWASFTYYIIIEAYPKYYYKKHIDNKEENIKQTWKEKVKNYFFSKKIINLKIKNMLFKSSVNELILLLKKEKMDSKTKIKVLIEHYERIQTSKIPLVIPYLVILSIIISIISLYYTVGEAYRGEALAMVVCSMIILAMIFLELKILRFIDKKMFNTPEKYDYLLMLLTEIYLNKFKGNYLSFSNED